MSEIETLQFKYDFKFDQHQDCSFTINVSKEDMSLIKNEDSELPEWAKLDNFKCPNCPLDSAEVQYCPMAASISEPVQSFLDIVSYEEVEITVETEDRMYTKRGSLQDGLSSLMGLYMATSGCPNLEKLKPMVCTHLPFANMDETIYRVLSMYALAQFFRNREKIDLDLDFKQLIDLYENINIVNEKFCERLQHLKIEDSNVNAVIILNNFAQFIPLSLDEEMLDEMKKNFQPYLTN